MKRNRSEVEDASRSCPLLQLPWELLTLILRETSHADTALFRRLCRATKAFVDRNEDLPLWRDKGNVFFTYASRYLWGNEQCAFVLEHAHIARVCREPIMLDADQTMSFEVVRQYDPLFAEEKINYGLIYTKAPEKNVLRAARHLTTLYFHENTFPGFAALQCRDGLHKLKHIRTGKGTFNTLYALKGGPYVETLEMQRNAVERLENLPTSLRRLDLYRNPLMDIRDVGRLKHLEVLCLAHCPFSIAPLPVSLTSLDISHVKIGGRIDLRYLTNLQDLKATLLALRVPEMLLPPQLRTLDIVSAHIHSWRHVNLPPGLTTLRCGGMYVTHTDDYTNLKALEHLHLNLRPFTSGCVLDCALLPPSLVSLSVNGGMDALQHAEKLIRLEKLTLDGTSLRADASKCALPPNLKMLEVGELRIVGEMSPTAFRPRHYPVTLVHLKLNYQHIASLKGVTFPESLKMLDLKWNKLKTLTDTPLPSSLEHLDVSHNEVISVGVARSLKRLAHLDISSNPVKALNGAVLPASLRVLRAKACSLSALSMEQLDELHTLELSFSVLTAMKDYVLPRFLRRLDLQNARCDALADLVLPPCLVTLNVAACNLTSFKVPEHVRHLRLNDLPNDLSLPKGVKHVELKYAHRHDASWPTSLVRFKQSAYTHHPRDGFDC